MEVKRLFGIAAVNALTAARVLLTVLFVFLSGEVRTHFLQTVLLFCAVYLSDLLDGKLARKLGAATAFGAFFDVLSDLLFIILSYSILMGQGLLPAWILPVALLKFLEFWVTSRLARKAGKCGDSAFLFDRAGKAAAAQFYILPLFAVLADSCLGPAAGSAVAEIYAGLLCLLAAISSGRRISACMAATIIIKHKKQQAIVAEKR